MTHLAFDEALHRYTVKGRTVPSVTQILDPLIDFSMVDREVLERARRLGTAVHRLIELEVAGTLDESSVSGILVGFLEQWRDFVKVTGFRTLHNELRLYSARYGYAGTMDLHGMLDDETLIDTKSGATPKTAGLQTAAYHQLGVENGYFPPTTRRRVLDLKEDSWKLSKPYTGTNDLRVFLSQLNVHNWKRGIA